MSTQIDAGRLALYSQPLGDGIVLRTAPSPTGPRSDPRVIRRPDPPVRQAWAYPALGHAERTRDGGRFEYATWYSDWDGTMRLVEIELR